METDAICIDTASNEQLQRNLRECLNLYDEVHGAYSEQDHSLFNYIVDNLERDTDGRLIAPCLWNEKLEPMLAKNFKLAHSILRSTLHKLQKKPDALKQYDEVIQEQLCEGIIEPIPNLDSFLQDHPNASFLPHSAVIRESAETTKCRVVFLSNMCEKRSGGKSHNDISFPGANLNYPLFNSLLLLRFDKFLLTFDLRKAFLMIKIRPSDSQKLLFLWCRDATNGDFTPVCYQFCRLGFGLRFSPSILLSCLYFILIKDAEMDDERLRELKRFFYSLAYMDNISVTSSNEEYLKWAYEKSFGIFNSYGFDLQKFYSNCAPLQAAIDRDLGETSSQISEFFGICWDRVQDTFSCRSIKLNREAKTRRQVLQSFQSQFDLMGMLIPILNRAKFFLHALQIDQNLSWDEELSAQRQKEWRCICKQLEDSIDFKISRNIGDRQNEYRLLTFTDASKDSIACVVYLWDLNTNHRSFILAKTRVVGKDLKSKSIPVLELVALSWGVEVSMQIYKFLTSADHPIQISEIILYTDSTISLSWIRARSMHNAKIEKKAVIVNNKLNKIMQECEIHSVLFRHIDGNINPADCATRAVSPALLQKSNYFTGPELDALTCTIDEVQVPYPGNDTSVNCFKVSLHEEISPILDLEKYSSFRRATKVATFVFVFLRNFKNRLVKKNPTKYGHYKSNTNCYYEAQRYILRHTQKKSFPNVFKFFNGEISKCDHMVTQLNLSLDQKGLIRVKSKLRKLNDKTLTSCPILLPKNCNTTNSILWDLHDSMEHAQTYKMLAVLRRQFYIPSAYSVVKKFIKNCVFCKSLYGRPIAVNVNDYRDYRINPEKRPFSVVMIDSAGPYHILDGKSDTIKTYVIIFTCMFTRAVNLIVANDCTTNSFLIALQLHVFEYGIMSLIISDNQPSFNAGTTYVREVMSTTEIQNFLKQNNVEKLTHENYPSGASFLGGAVESMVGQVKNILYSSNEHRKLTKDQFQFVVAEAKALVNKRPIAFKNSLSDNNVEDSPCTITPEVLLKGYEVPSFNILAQDRDEDASDISWEPSTSNQQKLFESFQEINKVRNNIYNLYESEFIQTLEKQATNKANRYKNSNQSPLQIGDLVAIKTKLLKPYFYPKGIVKNIEYNDINDINAVTVRKSNKELVRRHPTEIILLMHCKAENGKD